MTNLINKILAKFNLKLEYIKRKEDFSFVNHAVNFLNNNPKMLIDHIDIPSPYVGDINYIQKQVNGEFPQVSGEIYYKSASEKYFCDYNGDENVPFEKMYETTTFTTEKLQNKLNEDCNKDL